MYDLIEKKRDGLKLTNKEIKWFVNGYTCGEIPDYQASAMLMAIYLKGLDNDETSCLTLEMAHSGDMLDLSDIPGVKVDKHSTGGVGDKTTLVIAPIVAACGVPVAKMSGRGLGHTGGTVDKLESIPGLKTELSPEEFFATVKKTGVAVVAQSGNLAPADKKLYALRDVTATVESIPLIAASVMSKKIAAGADAILLDVKVGSGAFMKTTESALELAKTMTEIGSSVGRETVALVTNMDIPLGNAIGNALEIAEVVQVLSGTGPRDLTDICVTLASDMLVLAQKGDPETCRALVSEALSSGRALEKLEEMVAAQHGDVSAIQNTVNFAAAAHVLEVTAPAGGFVTAIDAAKCGVASLLLGAGRRTKESVIDYSAGVILVKKPGDTVEPGDVLGRLYTSDAGLLEGAKETFLSAYTIGKTAPEHQKTVFARVTREGVQLY